MSRDYKLFIVDAFTTKALKGNPAGVVILHRPMDEEIMQKIASELKQSETAFIEKLDVDLFRLRFFTPITEVDLCGHAIIASFWTLADRGYIDGLYNGIKTVEMYSNVGKLAIDLDYHRGKIRQITMAQASGTLLGRLKDIDGVCSALGIHREDMGLRDKNIEPIIASTGLEGLMFPIKDRKTLNSLKPDMNRILEISKQEKFYAINAYTLDSDAEIVYQRNFIPRLGIPEESATGTSAGALLYTLWSEEILSKPKIRISQGETMNRPSEIFGEIKIDDSGVETVYIGGKGKIILEGVIRI